ncbi:MAG: MFS transporter [Streptosporangiaceae bacterium]
MSKRVSGYRAFLSHPGVLRLLLAGLLARLPSGMIGLAVVLTVARATDSYALAGIASATYAVGSGAITPWKSRVMARRGARTIVARAAVAQGVLLVALAVTAMVIGPAWLEVLIAALTGAAQPPLNAMMRTVWSRLLSDDKAARAAASSFETMAVDLVFVTGPLVVSAVLLAAAPAAALIIAGTARIAGSLLAVSAPAVAGTVPGHGGGSHRGHRVGLLRSGRVLAMLAISFLTFGSIVAVEVAVAAVATRQGDRSLAGILIATLSVGGLAGGLIWGSWPPPGRATVHATILLAVLAAGWFGLGLTDSAGIMAAIIVVAGVAMNPAITSEYDILSQVASPDSLTEAYGWFDALNAAGGAVGAAAGGWLAQRSTSGAFVLAGSMALGAAVISALASARPRARPAEPADPRRGSASGGDRSPAVR